MKPSLVSLLLPAVLAAAIPHSALAQEPEGSEGMMNDSMSDDMGAPDETLPVTWETVQVTATRLPEDVEVVPVSITVLDGADLRDRGVQDLSEALSLTAGITTSPGGDGGPATTIPELWGLREADAYLLVVDGVPRGGAFNPDPASVELTGVDRIEILRGAAPVLYGATSFVGVIHVIHHAPGEAQGVAEVSGGSYDSGAARVETPLPGGGSFRHSLIAAVDFGPEAEGGILDPETAKSYEVGLKGRPFGGRFDWDLSVFRMDFTNLVLPATVNGLPQLVNAGEQRFEGVELSTEIHFRSDLLGRLGAAWHDAKFQDYERPFDGVLTQLDGNRLELSAQELASAGVVYAPAEGFTAQAGLDSVGRRFLDQRNRAEADAYTAWWAGVGYRWSGWEVRADGRNLGDERAPVAESELGDAQYYLLPSRSFRVTVGRSW
jgi:outer membrane receptor protein involved in Fe transport